MHFDLKATREDSFTLAVNHGLYSTFAENSIPVPNRLLVAFSGGPDSTALLIALNSFAKVNRIDLQACHVNHGLRGEESDQDEEFCRSICKSLDIALHVERINAASSSEAQLRKVRYEALALVAARIQSKACITGHTLDDQVETMLFRLFRGTGPTGFLGIPAFRRVSDRFILIRPLLNLGRADCLAFLERLKIEARIDSSNNDNSYSRNFIRNQILPLVETRFPGYRERIDQLRRVMDGDETLLNCLSQDAVLGLGEFNPSENVWSLDQFNELPLSLRRRVLYQSFRKRGIENEFARIESMLELIDLDGESAVCLNEEWEIRISHGELHWRNRLDICESAELPEIAVPLRSDGTTLIHKLGLAIRVERVDDEPDSIKLPGSQDLEFVGDLSEVGQLIMRLRAAGDQIQPLGMSCMVRLKKFLHTHKSSKTLSFGGRVLVMANDNEVLWVPGCGISQRIAVGKKATHRISVMRIAPDDSAVC
ncbi:MAG: tRNA lysidine(34) synthetase TilS [Candidatus Obscuribacterales bacterium]|nr:tRNA lysidine(34) synthetase TilS [Candidatus Obscuribacterales bacterium]